MKGPNYRPEGVQAHPEPEQNIINPVNPVERYIFPMTDIILRNQ
jgi:hypothetical protein